jgi:hypothetical protein
MILAALVVALLHQTPSPVVELVAFDPQRSPCLFRDLADWSRNCDDPRCLLPILEKLRQASARAVAPTKSLRVLEVTAPAGAEVWAMDRLSEGPIRASRLQGKARLSALVPSSFNELLVVAPGAPPFAESVEWGPDGKASLAVAPPKALRGRVTVKGKPEGDALLVCRGQCSAVSTRSRTDGTFELEGVELACSLSAMSARGFFETTATRAELEPLEVRLEPLPMLEGRVLTAGKTPVPFAEVIGFPRGADSGTSVTADADGRFALPNVPGRRLATVSAATPDRSLHGEAKVTGKGPVEIVTSAVR